MAKRAQQESGEERVTVKSRPMMSFIARVPSNVSSSASVSLVKRSYGGQDPWSSISIEDRSGRLDKGTDLFEASDHHWQRTKRSVYSVTMHVHARAGAAHFTLHVAHVTHARCVAIFCSRRLLIFLRSRQRKMAMIEHGSHLAVLNGFLVHVPAVSPRELTGTIALKRGIPPGARGGLQILGMVSSSVSTSRRRWRSYRADRQATLMTMSCPLPWSGMQEPQLQHCGCTQWFIG